MSATTAEQAPPAKKANSKGRNKAFLIFFAILLVLAAVGLLYWLHARQFESTDDAQVDAHLNPISARVDGTITHVYTDANHVVHVGDPLVDLDPSDFKVALAQALAQLQQARSMVIAERPNLPITQVQNTTNISTGQAEVANAQAALAAAERDREANAAKVAEAQANNGRAQADLARYQILISKEEVSQQEFDQIAATAKAQAATVAANEAALHSADRTMRSKEGATGPGAEPIESIPEQCTARGCDPARHAAVQRGKRSKFTGTGRAGKTAA